MSIPKKYLPDTLTKETKRKSEEGKDRPKVDSYKSKEVNGLWHLRKYDTVITDDDFISRT